MADSRPKCNPVLSAKLTDSMNCANLLPSQKDAIAHAKSNQNAKKKPMEVGDDKSGSKCKTPPTETPGESIALDSKGQNPPKANLKGKAKGKTKHARVEDSNGEEPDRVDISSNSDNQDDLP
ncbi:hypothetical protein GYMLUDRAFT_60984 [Collybiopsis luxurians FD-317 M1]|uniref:Uncharacterized protein n=1 Tax=Collybiopsis luxurians FD-317 M1 TaxID=944289 RepID=A0A0D0CHX1_9AGAR|nr:hypothetical protein GYMLUDRAFT_60984 [Collybiopsis luxurians FD-317 M1]